MSKQSKGILSLAPLPKKSLASVPVKVASVPVKVASAKDKSWSNLDQDEVVDDWDAEVPVEKSKPIRQLLSAAPPVKAHVEPIRQLSMAPAKAQPEPRPDHLKPRNVARAEPEHHKSRIVARDQEIWGEFPVLTSSKPKAKTMDYSEEAFPALGKSMADNIVAAVDAVEADDWSAVAKEKEERKDEVADINESMFAPGTSDNLVSVDSFDDMGLHPLVLRGVYGGGFEKPSAVQKYGIPTCLTKAIQDDGIERYPDVIIQAPSGTGKTLSFATVAVNRSYVLRQEKAAGPYAIIISPTHELSEQSLGVVGLVGSYAKINAVNCVGGERVADNIAAIRGDAKAGKPSADIIVATPGRLLDLIERQVFPLENVKLLILDEADRMLSDVFADNMKHLISRMDKTVQIGLFSATMPSEAIELSDVFLRNARKILLKPETLTLDGIQQRVVFLNNLGGGRRSDDLDQDTVFNAKVDALIEILRSTHISQAIIYCNSSDSAEALMFALRREKYPCDVIHGKLSSQQRQEAMKGFRGKGDNGMTRYLVATDIIARGIDVQSVSTVINFDLPMSYNDESYCETYLHRIGRSGRYGRKGTAINLCVQQQSKRGGRRYGDDEGRGARRERLSDIMIINRLTELYQIDMPELSTDIRSLM
jgi:translation initiation factor 4A